jgi:hypothetical protein
VIPFYLEIYWQPKNDLKGETNKLGIIGLMAFFISFKSLLGCLKIQCSNVLLNNFSESYPNLTLIAKRLPAKMINVEKKRKLLKKS